MGRQNLTVEIGRRRQTCFCLTLTDEVAIPATLYFPTSIVTELNEICQSLGYTPEQLVIEVLEGQIDYWNELYDHVMTLPVEPEDFVWHKDPVYCLACVTTVHIINSFTRCSHEPVAFAQLKEEALIEWVLQLSRRR